MPRKIYTWIEGVPSSTVATNRFKTLTAARASRFKYESVHIDRIKACFAEPKAKRKAA
jgi:hypothetical protein